MPNSNFQINLSHLAHLLYIKSKYSSLQCKVSTHFFTPILVEEFKLCQFSFLI